MTLRFILPITAAILLTACEETIDRNHRFTPASTPEIKRSVLVEEYSGTECIDCPHGHDTLEALSKYYNTAANFEQDNGLIIVNIYTPHRDGDTERGGLVAPEAANLVPEGIVLPQARVNRNGQVLDLAVWSRVIAGQISRTPGVDFPDRMTATTNGSTIWVDGVVLADNNISDATLHVWLIEDNITYPQAMPDGTTDSKYVHRNVYRSRLTESYTGTDFALTRNVARRFSFSHPVSDNWNIDNVSIVAFVETPSEGVLNACKTKVLQL